MEAGRKGPVWRAVRLTTLVLALPLAWVGWNQATFNFAVLQPGRLYRSGQMHPGVLQRTLHNRGIKTVLNLRGPNQKESWYLDERAATLAAGATQVDIPLSSCIWMSRVQLRALVQILDTCEYPVLIHCAWGSERTGLASALAELLQPGCTLSQARGQLALRYLYARMGGGRIMAEFFDQYEDWLRQNRLEHRPDVFRHWAASAYEPQRPSREEWPYDPFPIFVETRPRPHSARYEATRTSEGHRATR
jgi:protein tyrosine phosphatase (PTP) superfamily phosphohydrolase (DUF442 family)